MIIIMLIISYKKNVKMITTHYTLSEQLLLEPIDYSGLQNCQQFGYRQMFQPEKNWLN